MTSNTCEWCNTTYPDFDKTETYMSILVFNKLHIICNSCYKHLRYKRRHKNE
jgi:hypothetical protein